MNPNRWTRAVLREKLISMDQGQEVVVIRSTIKHRTNLGATFWVMSTRPSGGIHQVSEYAFGANAKQLLTYGEEVEMAKQPDCTERAKRLLANSAYDPSNRAKQTYLDMADDQIPKRFNYDPSTDTNAVGS